MKKNFVILFLFLFVASIMGGMSLQNVFSFSTVVGYTAGVVFLLLAITLAIRNTNYSKT